MILKDGEDIVIAGDDPKIDTGRVEYRLLASRHRQQSKRILPLLRREGIEAGRKRRFCCRLHRDFGPMLCSRLLRIFALGQARVQSVAGCIATWARGSVYRLSRFCPGQAGV